MNNNIVSLVSDALVKAGSTFREDKKQAYRQAIEKETINLENLYYHIWLL